MGARRIAGITVEIGGDTTKLTTALKDVDKALSTTQSSLRDVNKLLKLDPGNTELLAQKHRLLGEAVSETKEKLATLKTAAEQANQALANGEITQSQYDALQREIIETEQKLKDLEKQAENSNVALQKIGQFGDKLQAVGDKVSGVGEDLTKSVTVPLAGIGTAAVATAANFESSMSQVQATMGITKDSMSTVNGETVNTMDTLSALAKQMGSETAFSASECAEALYTSTKSRMNSVPRRVARAAPRISATTRQNCALYSRSMMSSTRFSRGIRFFLFVCLRMVKVTSAFRLSLVNFLIDCIGFQQIFVGVKAADPAVVQHQDAVRVLHTGNALGNDDLGGSGDYRLQGIPDFGIRGRIHGAGGIVQNQHFGLLQQGPGNTEPLLLPAGEVGPAPLHPGVIALWQMLDKLVRTGHTAGFPVFLRVAHLLAPAQVV